MCSMKCCKHCEYRNNCYEACSIYWEEVGEEAAEEYYHDNCNGYESEE